MAAARGSCVIEAPDPVHPLLVAMLTEPGRPVVVVTATGREAEDIAASIPELVPDAKVAVFPSWETLPHERLSPSSDTVGRRVAVMRRLAHPDADGSEPIDVVVLSLIHI